MSTVDSLQYTTVTGTVAAMAAFNTAIKAQVALGFSMQGPPYSDGTNITQVLFKGGISSFVQDYPITIAPTTGIAGSGVFTLSGNVTSNFNAGYRFTVSNSTGNNGVYTVRAGGSTFGGGNTVIPVVEAVPSAVVDGDILLYS